MVLIDNGVCRGKREPQFLGTLILCYLTVLLCLQSIVVILCESMVKWEKNK